jgi:hypothetical protein
VAFVVLGVLYLPECDDPNNFSAVPRELASAAPVWGEGEPEPSSFEPVSVRRYFTNRAAYRTRGRRRVLRDKRPLVRQPARTHRTRRRRNARTVRARARSPGRLADDEPEPSDLGVAALLSGGAV